MDFGILGPLEVRDGEQTIKIGGAKQRALLGILLVHAGRTVPTDRLIELLWGDRRPARAEAALQVYVSQLRKALEPERAPGEEAHLLVTRGGGYELAVDLERLDAARFEHLAAEGRVALIAGEPQRASALLREALDLWRGPALADFAYETFAQTEIGRLEEERLAALEDRIDADLAGGGHGHLTGELEALVTERPLRERLRGQLMLALYRAGRQAEALEAYQAARHTLVEELGIEPSPELQRLEKAILQQDPALAAPSRASTAPPPSALAREERRTVTVVFADLAGPLVSDESADPEALQRILARYLAAAAEIFSRYGGTVERFPGATLVAVFGVPELHEDDALRAVRAAADLAGAVHELEPGLAARIGVATGEALVNADGAPRELTGSAMSVARQLRDAAVPGEILLAARTHDLVAHAVSGEAAPAGFRLRGIAPEAAAIVRHEDAPLVGRAAELAQLRAAFERCAQERSARLVTVLGPPGVGKSRLVRELAAKIGDAATTVVGRCLAYGEGITYWGLREILAQLAGPDLPSGVLAALAQDEQAALVADRLAAAVGAAGHPGATEDTHWAIRRLLEAFAARRPLVVVFEDIHWAEPTFLDLIEYLATFSLSSPVLIVCVARNDLLDTRPSWSAPSENATLLVLQPLSDAESNELVDILSAEPLGGHARERIVEAAEGNPLFLEQLVALQVDAPEGELTVPASLQALLAARVARLPARERALLERAAVEGRVFHRGAVAELLPPEERATVPSVLVSLARKGLIRPERSLFVGDDGYRFGHILLRDAAYEALTKRERCELHVRFASAFTAIAGARLTEFREIVGYHLEQAYHYEEDLGEQDTAAHRDLGERAAEHLQEAGQAALGRTDLPAAINLLERTARLLGRDGERIGAVRRTLATALLEAGRLDEAVVVLDLLDEHARAHADARLGAHAGVERLLLRLQTDTSGALAEAARTADELESAFTAAGDDLGLARLWRVRALGKWFELRFGDADQALALAAEHASRAGDERERVDLLCWLASSALHGPTPVPAAIVRCLDLRERVRPHLHAEARILHPLAGLHAMAGDFEQANAFLDEGNTILRELGLTMHSAVSHSEALVALLAGDPARAEERLRADYERLAGMGEKALFSTTAAVLAHALCAQDRFEEAYAFTETAERAGAAEDLYTQMRWRAVRARILARRGEVATAAGLAGEALELAGRTDSINDEADVRVDAADVLRIAGRDEEAEALLAEAVALYERKGNAVSAGAARALLDAARASSG